MPIRNFLSRRKRMFGPPPQAAPPMQPPGLNYSPGVPGGTPMPERRGVMPPAPDRTGVMPQPMVDPTVGLNHSAVMPPGYAGGGMDRTNAVMPPQNAMPAEGINRSAVMPQGGGPMPEYGIPNAPVPGATKKQIPVQ